MPYIQLETRIKANIKICFDLSRSIELHTYSTSQTNERAISGVTSGLIGKDELVTWEATHLGFRQQLTSVVNTFASPHVFTDEQVKGIFGAMKHVHMFEEQGEYTIMKD